jgi:hypothetical protein
MSQTQNRVNTQDVTYSSVIHLLLTPHFSILTPHFSLLTPLSSVFYAVELAICLYLCQQGFKQITLLSDHIIWFIVLLVDNWQLQLQIKRISHTHNDGEIIFELIFELKKQLF